MRLWLIPLILSSMFSFLHCSNNGGSPDGSLDGNDASDGDAGQGDEIETPFRLIFESGAQACAQFADKRTAAQELALRGHILFNTTTLSLPRDVDNLVADLIKEVRISGPNPVTATADSDGEIVHSKQTALWGWCHIYEFNQAFLAGSRPLVIKATFKFCHKNAVSDPDQLVFDQDNPGVEPQGLVEDSQVTILGLLDNGEDYLTEKQFYRSCTYSDLPQYKITVELAGSDQIVLYKRYQQPLMASGPAALTRAEIDIDGEQRTVDDYFKLAYSADMHNFNERYLVVLDPPLGSIHGLHFEEANQNDPPTVIDILGEDLDPINPVEQRNVVSYSDVEN
ncbi:MAG: hypothetical protein JRJ19_10405 [Deltaproteobacteria bacterium]|nr:hypothetical protein [Deltaproteobacteria bacterium]MBW1872468.1 hypothetical protein [Deltaproteobacteria bacterium]